MKKLIKEGGFATPNQLKMYIDHFTNIDVQDYTTYEFPKPILHKDLEVDSMDEDDISLSDEEIADAIDEINEDISDYYKKMKILTDKRDAIRSEYKGDDGLPLSIRTKLNDVKSEIKKLESEKSSYKNNGSLKEESLEELSKKTLSNYSIKSAYDVFDLNKKEREAKTPEEKKKFFDKGGKRVSGLELAGKKLKEHDEQNMGNYTFDSSINLIKFEDGMRIVQGLFHSEYEDLFYKVWIEDKSTHEIVYKNDYGTEAHNEEEISDEVVDDYLDKLIQYAIEADPRLDESFEYLEELSKKTLASYLSKSSEKSSKIFHKAMNTSDHNQGRKLAQKSDKIDKSRNLAMKKIDEENLNELSKETMRNYVYKAAGSLNSLDKKKEDLINHALKDEDKRKHLIKKAKFQDVKYGKRISTISKVKYKIKEDVIQESNISMLKNMKAKSIELKFKTGDTQSVHSDEAKILLDTYDKLNDDEKKKFEDMLDKSTSSFMLAYRKAMQ